LPFAHDFLRRRFSQSADIPESNAQNTEPLSLLLFTLFSNVHNQFEWST